MTPEPLFLENLPLVDRAARRACGRRGLRPEEIEDFLSHVKLRLIEDDYAILRKFEGRASLGTYLEVVVNRLLLDYQNHFWGKWRPCAEAKRLGPVAIELERLTVRDGLGFDEACEVLRTGRGARFSVRELADLAAKLPPRHRRRIEGEERLASLPAPSGGAEERVEGQERRALAGRVWRAFRSAICRLPAEDRLILRMRGRFQVAEIARALHLDPKPLYRRLERLLEKARIHMEAEGIQAADVEEILGDEAPAWVWEADDPDPSKER
jgi:RNA polymerase sigma factor for flagellar operon FliA